ncbi:MAG: ribonuclease Y [Candidatus Paceibacterota bacterium]
MDLNTTLTLLIAALLGLISGYFLRILVSAARRESIELKIRKQLLNARENAEQILSNAEQKADAVLEQARQDIREKEENLQKSESRLIKREELLDRRQSDLDANERKLEGRLGEAQKLRDDAEETLRARTRELEQIAGLSSEEARERLLETVEKQSEEDLLVRLQKLEQHGAEKLETKARDILTSAIHRMANSVSSDVMTTTVSIPSDEIKGKVIGKEGRNIRSFERITGVELIVDDTPGAITISSFDPVRRQVARIALENLILDGRIQPSRIEEMVTNAKDEINAVIKEKGEQAVYEVGIYNLDPRIISILGRLYFRTSYGQNVLQHSIEMAHIAGVLAEELGANVAIAKAGALLHDIGKAVDHEVSGTHVEIGRRILQKFGADEAIIKAMQAHHGEYPFETVESIIVQAADAISGARPGARRDTVENYLKRLSDLEGIATGVEGVEKAYALQAGREIRIFVTPEKVSDIEARQMAREIAVQIENELKYPGEIKVNVIRESRAIEFAR